MILMNCLAWEAKADKSTQIKSRRPNKQHAAETKSDLVQWLSRDRYGSKRVLVIVFKPAALLSVMVVADKLTRNYA